MLTLKEFHIRLFIGFSLLYFLVRLNDYSDLYLFVDRYYIGLLLLFSWFILYCGRYYLFTRKNMFNEYDCLLDYCCHVNFRGYVTRIFCKLSDSNYYRELDGLLGLSSNVLLCDYDNFVSSNNKCFRLYKHMDCRLCDPIISGDYCSLKYVYNSTKYFSLILFILSYIIYYVLN